ncbi:hypothetical protein BRE01_48950 [Brevibacillus reuszeri]|uniref:HTH luxR-type domain-containing protein n=1 Tax=Brevibacillus reuszeri TaxID=54915 RepID=A0A0K9YL75_9BACL|nr:hypothetical protein [Brevibacillus reuszeri]KNB69498.1 hypothetical protein ADS79_26895 [Brevibacillus reuszeri]MED1861626.1 hypothetical protein [Brevibacillus reuszeri]GED71193.1 hypothetical protein BRE01_48950 [Brevibacillus reuszeri]
MSVVIEKSMLIEKVCEKCPATRWGQKAICSVHSLHIGEIECCPEWDKHMVNEQGLKEHDGQIAFMDLEPAMEWVQRTEEELRDYHFMLREIDRLQGYLEDAGEGTVGAYGIDASMPKGKGKNGDKTHAEVVRRERKWKRLEKLQDAVERIERAAESITDEKEKTVLDAIMDGEKNNFIARQIGVSRQRYYEIKRSVIIQMAWLMYGNNEAA